MKGRIALTIFGAVTSLGTLTWVATAGDSDVAWIQGPPPPVNSCAIHCPADAPAYSGKSGSVICSANSAPKCQCQEETEPMAYCPMPGRAE